MRPKTRILGLGELRFKTINPQGEKNTMKSNDYELSAVEYIWLDGRKPTQEFRSKSRVLPIERSKKVGIESFPDWGYDGSSTWQAVGDDSDLVLRPVYFCEDPVRGPSNYVVLCEVFEGDGKTPHPTNKRANLRRVMEAGGSKFEPWIGFEQEYTFFQGPMPLGWPEGGYPAPQGPFYCGVGAEVAFGREIVEEHLMTCLEAGLCIFGINAEVMPGQWEFQMGYRGITTEVLDPLSISDQHWVARYFLCRIAEKYEVGVSFDCKPVKGDWNGAGMHTNFSTKDTRNPSGGFAAIEKAIERLSAKHREHIKVYGYGNEDRLTGLHETCHISEFKYGVANRGASIRIPRSVAENGHGYFEDRRPGANANVYEISTYMVSTVCGID